MEEVIKDNIMEVGNKVQIRSFEWYNLNKDDIGTIRGKMNGYQNSFIKDMYVYCGQIGVIKDFVTIGDKVVGYRVYIDDRSECWTWQNWMFENSVVSEYDTMIHLFSEYFKDTESIRIKPSAPPAIIFYNGQYNIFNVCEVLFENKSLTVINNDGGYAHISCAPSNIKSLYYLINNFKIN